MRRTVITLLWNVRVTIGLAMAVLAGAAWAAENVFIPNFWDPGARPERPDLSAVRVIRFLTDDEYPPMHFARGDGTPTGFSVDLAQAACDKLAVACTIQVRRFETLLEALAEGRGDAIAAAIPTTAQLRERFAVTNPYHRMPARFAARKGASLPEPSPTSLAGRSVGVVGNSAHEAYLGDFFPKADRRRFIDFAAARAALRRGEIDYLFADGLTLALWLGGVDAAECCAFTGGPYLSIRYFGEGVGFVVRREDEALRRALDYALQKLWDDGVYTELYLRYFPLSFY
jgi:polar amino acid transport system substrate-binding protein